MVYILAGGDLLPPHPVRALTSRFVILGSSRKLTLRSSEMEVYVGRWQEGWPLCAWPLVLDLGFQVPSLHPVKMLQRVLSYRLRDATQTRGPQELRCCTGSGGPRHFGSRSSADLPSCLCVIC